MNKKLLQQNGFNLKKKRPFGGEVSSRVDQRAHYVLAARNKLEKKEEERSVIGLKSSSFAPRLAIARSDKRMGKHHRWPDIIRITASSFSSGMLITVFWGNYHYLTKFKELFKIA